MSEKRSAKASKHDDPTVANQKSRVPASSPKKKGKTGAGSNYSTIIKVLYGAAIVLAIAACAVIGVKTYDDLTAEKSANTLLNAYKELQTADPTAVSHRVRGSNRHCSPRCLYVTCTCTHGRPGSGCSTDRRSRCTHGRPTYGRSSYGCASHGRPAYGRP